MMRLNLQTHHRAGRLARQAALLLIPAVLALGCAGNDKGDEGGTSTPTVPVATQTVITTQTVVPSATAVAGTATPTVAVSTPTPTATTAINSNAMAACEKLAGCGQCFSNSLGTCIATAVCAQRLSTDVAVCINGANGCNATSLGDCLFPGCDGNDPTAECQ